MASNADSEKPFTLCKDDSPTHDCTLKMDKFCSICICEEIEAKEKRIEELEALCQFHIAESKKVDEVVLKENAKLKALEQRLRAASMDDFDRIAELEAELIQVRGLSAFRKDENERLRGDLEVMRLQRNATHCSRCPECSKEFVYSYGSGTEGKDDE